jgi:hypothetical protein
MTTVKVGMQGRTRRNVAQRARPPSLAGLHTRRFFSELQYRDLGAGFAEHGVAVALGITLRPLR